MSKDDTRGSRGGILVLIVAAAFLAAALLIASSQLGGTGAKDVQGLYSGIPQKGTTLGEADAPVTVTVYEDFQCPFCGRLARETFPRVVEDYVRSGEVKVVSRPLVFLGKDSLEAAKAALSAGDQDLYWQYHSLLFENQGAENSGYVTEGFLEDLARQTPDLDVGGSSYHVLALNLLCFTKRSGEPSAVARFAPILRHAANPLTKALAEHPKLGKIAPFDTVPSTVAASKKPAWETYASLYRPLASSGPRFIRGTENSPIP